MSDFLFGTIYPWVSDIALLVFVVDLIIVIPISFCLKEKTVPGLILLNSSFLFGLQLWLSGLMLTWKLWGIVATIIGLLIVGIGVVPMAIVATLLKGMWSECVQLLLSVFIVFGSRIWGVSMDKR